ncbi:amino acid ABC transporter ATP-binding protein [Syntrophomonas wolfei]|jgi:ABC-type polar amino acid transport system ATPase subunit|uniref:amino acid ABC transporter ATP-binding protein n=1 Tax=Syntrophomonas wolfei TaxID=863 RepID=UPI000B0B2DE7|nr:amino acid ABC transporter ATP-binding protein [Syntrophomonas wolfei]
MDTLSHLIEIKDIYKSFGDLSVLRGVSLNVSAGEILGIIGASGSGKSTLIRCINGLEATQRGEILIKGQRLNSSREAVNVRKKIGMVFQNFNLFPHYTVLQNITGPCRVVRKLSKKSAEELGESLLEKVRLKDKMAQYPGNLSGGEKQRVAIARVLAMEPEIILFDEPTSALDPELAYEVFDIIKLLAEDGMAMMIVTHQIGFIKNLAHLILFIDNGKIACSGNPDYILNECNHPHLQDFLMRLRENI